MRSSPPPSAASPTARARSSATPGRWVVLAVTFALRAPAALPPLRYAELAGRSASRRGDPAAGRRARRGARAAPRQGMVIDAGDPDRSASGRSSPTRARRRAFAALEARARARLGDDAASRASRSRDGSVKMSAAWLIERAGFTRGHGDPATVAISGKHTLALTNRGAGTTEQLVALAREIAAGVRGGVRRRARARAGVRRSHLETADARPASTRARGRYRAWRPPRADQAQLGDAAPPTRCPPPLELWCQVSKQTKRLDRSPPTVPAQSGKQELRLLPILSPTFSSASRWTVAGCASPSAERCSAYAPADLVGRRARAGAPVGPRAVDRALRAALRSPTR